MPKMTPSQRRAFVDGMLAAGQLMLAFDKPNWKTMKPGLWAFIGRAAEEILNGKEFPVLLAKYVEENEKSQIAWQSYLKTIEVRRAPKTPWWNFWSAT